MSLLIDANGYLYPIPHNSSIVTSIKPGWYDLQTPYGMPHYMKETNSGLNEVYVYDSGSLFEKLRDEVKTFFVSKRMYVKHGLVHKRGFLLHGKPGTGKTAMMKSLQAEFVKLGGIVVSSSAMKESAAFDLLQQIISCVGIPVMVAIDEIENLLKNRDDDIESISSLLDGSWMSSSETSETFLVVATTNNIEDMHSRFSSRPGRFDRVIKFDSMERETFNAICKKLDLTSVSCKIYDLFGGVMTPATLSEIATRINVFGEDLETALNGVPGLEKNEKGSADGGRLSV